MASFWAGRIPCQLLPLRPCSGRAARNSRTGAAADDRVFWSPVKLTTAPVRCSSAFLMVCDGQARRQRSVGGVHAQVSNYPAGAAARQRWRVTLQNLWHDAAMPLFSDVPCTTKGGWTPLLNSSCCRVHRLALRNDEYLGPDQMNGGQ